MPNEPKKSAISPESTIDSANRRSFLRKTALLGASVGVGGALLGNNEILPRASARSAGSVCGCCPTCYGVKGVSVTGTGVEGFSTKGYGVHGYSCKGTGVVGGGATYGVWGESCSGYGVYGDSYCAGGVVGYSSLGPGVYGITECLAPVHPSLIGVYGQAMKGTGVSGQSICGPGVRGVSSGNTGCSNGVVGCSSSTSASGILGKGKKYGVFGSSSTGCAVYGCSPCGIGVVGVSKERSGVYGKSTNKYGVYGCSPCSIGIYGKGKTYGVQGCSTNSCGRHVGVVGNTGHGNGSAGVAGYAIGGCCRNQNVTAGVFGQSDAYFGQGVSGVANPVGGCGGGVGVIGKSNGLCGIGVKGVAGTTCTIPIVASGASGQFANLQEWETGCATRSVVNKCGWFGVGSNYVPTTLTVGGSLSARTVVATTNYEMGATDFAVLASGKIKITLPPASTATGMIIFVKNTSTDKVTIEPFGNSSESDSIEGATSKHLKKQYDSLQLISNGSNEWFVLGNSICGAFTS
jgi:hypothetical protein